MITFNLLYRSLAINDINLKYKEEITFIYKNNDIRLFNKIIKYSLKVTAAVISFSLKYPFIINKTDEVIINIFIRVFTRSNKVYI